MTNQTQDTDNDTFLMLTPAGVLQAFALEKPSSSCLALQSLMPQGNALSKREWLLMSQENHNIFPKAMLEGWIHSVSRPLKAPHVRLDNYLPHAIAGLSGQRMAALGSGDGFCLASTGYSQDEADTLCAMAADYMDFLNRQKQRGFKATGRAVSFHESIDLLLPVTTFTLVWISGISYWIIMGGEPLLNNRALVELVWGIKAAGDKFA